MLNAIFKNVGIEPLSAQDERPTSWQEKLARALDNTDFDSVLQIIEKAMSGASNEEAQSKRLKAVMEIVAQSNSKNAIHPELAKEIYIGLALSAEEFRALMEMNSHHEDELDLIPAAYA